MTKNHETPSHELLKETPTNLHCITQNTQKNPSFSPTRNCKQPASIAATPTPLELQKLSLNNPEKIHNFSSPKTEQKNTIKLLPFSHTQSLTKLQQNTSKIRYNSHFPTNQKASKEKPFPQPKNTESYILFP